MGFLSSLGGIAGGLFGGPVGSAIGGVVGGLLDGGSESSNVRAAAQSQAASTEAATAEQRRQSDRTYNDFAPYRAAGLQALGQYQAENNGNTSSADALAEPGYQFGLQQGQLGLDRKAAAGGGRVSGAALKSAAEYATNYATTGYSAAYQRRQDRLNRLASLAGIGQSAAGSSAQAGQSASNNISGLMTAQGNAAGAAQIAQGNIWAGAGNQLGAAAQRWASTSSAPASTGWNASYDSQGLNMALG